MKAKITTAFFYILLISCFGLTKAFAQSDEKEGNNSFAMYTKTGDFKHLEAARKFADNAYKERRDSSSYENNLLRSLVYSSLSVADSNRKLKYSKDPIEEAKFSLAKLTDKQLNYENATKLIYIHRKLANAHLILANRSLNNNKYEEAYNHFKEVDSFGKGEINVNLNLSVLSSRLKRNDEAITYYNRYLEGISQLKPDNVLILADLYAKAQKPNDELNTLLKGRDLFPDDRDILFKIINIYAKNGAYSSVVPLIDNAIRMDPNNIDLNYLAGFAYEITGNRKLAEQYYKAVIKIDDNNYNGNYELGLLYLKDFINDSSNSEKLELARKYLLKANEIDPNSVNALRSLAVLFNKSGDTIQYERVINQLNQNNN